MEGRGGEGRRKLPKAVENWRGYSHLKIARNWLG